MKHLISELKALEQNLAPSCKAWAEIAASAAKQLELLNREVAGHDKDMSIVEDIINDRSRTPSEKVNSIKYWVLQKETQP